MKGVRVPSPNLTFWGRDDCRRLHETTVTLLEDVGVEILQDERSLELFKELGARVEGTRVRLDQRARRGGAGECAEGVDGQASRR